MEENKLKDEELDNSIKKFAKDKYDEIVINTPGKGRQTFYIKLDDFWWNYDNIYKK